VTALTRARAAPPTRHPTDVRPTLPRAQPLTSFRRPAHTVQTHLRLSAPHLSSGRRPAQPTESGLRKPLALTPNALPKTKTGTPSQAEPTHTHTLVVAHNTPHAPTHTRTRAPARPHTPNDPHTQHTSHVDPCSQANQRDPCTGSRYVRHRPHATPDERTHNHERRSPPQNDTLNRDLTHRRRTHPCIGIRSLTHVGQDEVYVALRRAG